MCYVIPSSLRFNHAALSFFSIQLRHYELIFRFYYVIKECNNEFSARVNHIRIDGSQGPSDGSRFCLGKISNPNRKQDITMVRHKLGNGIDLIYEMGVVKLENLSEREFMLA